MNDKARGGLLERLIPEALGFASADELRRARLVAFFALVMTSVAIPVTLVQAFFGVRQLAWIPALAGLVSALVPWLLRRSRSVALATHLLVGICATGVATMSVFRGGFGQPVVMVLAIVPMLALAFGGRRTGRTWLVVTIVMLVMLGIAQRFFGPLPKAPLVDPLATNWPGHLIYVVCCYLLMGVYVRLREQSLGEQHAALEQLHQSQQRLLASENEAQLLRSHRMAELGTLAAGVAHEINNPLAFVQTNIQYLREEGRALDAAEVDEILAETLEGTRRIERIVRDVGTFSRAESDDALEDVDLHQVLEESISLLWNQLRHRTSLTRDFAADLPLVPASAARLSQVFVNLLSNALHAIPEDRSNGSLTVRTRRDGGRAIVEIEDDGAGIPKEVQRRVFEPFFTTKPQGQGTGLGLSICFGIISKLGGTIDVESVPGEGTTVRLSLPAVAFGARSSRAANSAAADATPS